jgi:hypothetical protein
MPKAGFEPAITASERSKTAHDSDRSVTATDIAEDNSVTYESDCDEFQRI